VIQGHRKSNARLVVALCVFVLGVCPTAAVAASGHQGGGSNDPGTGGKHGQDCAPGYHDTANGSCEHNGDGGGNCGDNQSGNDNGLGNNGNDNGFGHKGDQCDPSSAPSGPPSSPGPPPSHPSPPATPNGPTTPAAPASDPPARDSNACATSFSLGRTHFIVGRRALLVIRVRDARGAPLQGVTVLVHGAGVRLTAATDSLGKVRFTVRPRSAGVIRVALVQPATCVSISRLARVTGVFKPPKPNYTG